MSKSSNNKLSSPKRERDSINILGVDTSTPDITVKDGMMAELYNLRYNDGAWRPVHMFDRVGEMPDGYRVAYHHPAAGEKVYIITDDAIDYYSYDVESSKRTLIASVDAVKDIKHFGNVLIFIGRNKHIEYYVLQEGTYYRFEKPDAPIVELEEGKRTPALISGFCEDPNGWEWDIPDDVPADTKHPYGFWALYDEGGNTTYPMSKDNKWWGEIAYFVVYRLKDGQIISPTPLGITASETVTTDYIGELGNNIKTYRKWYKANFNNTDMWGILSYIFDFGQGGVISTLEAGFTHPQMQYYSPTLNISIPSALTPLVQSVAVYSTRINSPFKFIETEGTDSHFADNKLPEQPFYLAKEIRISEFTDNKYSLLLDYNLLKDVTSNAVYVPSNNIHDILFGTTLDYNERLHVGDITAILHTPIEETNVFNIAELGQTLYTNFCIESDNNTYRTDSVSIRSDASRKAGYTSIISYHDNRAASVDMSLIRDPQDNITFMPSHVSIILSPAINNNIAYHVAHNDYLEMTKDSLHYKPITFIFAPKKLSDFKTSSGNTIVQPNKLMVSQINNPFAFDFANTYSFGSADNNVLAMQSAAVEMSDTKFGEYPLFVFTEGGIYGLQSGAESVYSNVISINYDHIINPRTLAINYNVVYITDKGIHLLNSGGSTLISQPIDTMLGYPNVDKMQRLYPLRSMQYNEIAFVVDGIAYIYSLINGVWSTRSFDMHPISQEEAYGYNEIFNIMKENTVLPNRCVIASRPIKLGSVEYKRLESFIPRFANLAEEPNMTLSIRIEGSNNCETWVTLREVDIMSNTVIRRTPSSHKYLRFSIDMVDIDEFSITNVDVEYYLRFLRRLR